MPATSVPGFLLDQYGRPAVFGGVGNLYRRTDDDSRLRPVPPSHFGDYLTLLSAGRSRALVSECRALASRGLVSALLDQKADYVAASGFRPRFAGEDSEYGAEALAALEQSLRICNIRGPRFDWRRTWRLAVPTRATDGRYFILLTQWSDTGWPAIQLLEGHRIGQRDDSEGIVKDEAITRTDDGTMIRGAYKGLHISNGIITTPQGTEVAYRVLGAEKNQDQDISARDMIHVATPSRYSEGSPPPELARALPDFMAIDVAQTCQLDQQILDAKLTVVERNASGKVDPAAMMAGMASLTQDGTPTEKIERAGFRYIKSGSGELSPWQSTRPSDQWMNFDSRVASRAAAAIRWRVEMLDPTALRGAATRAFQDQINTAIAEEFSTIEAPAVRVVGYFVAKLTQLGIIPAHAEWASWTIAPPPWFEVDRASARLDLEDVAAGRTPMSVLHARDGHTTAEVYTARATAYELAKATHAEHPEVPFEFILGDLGRTNSRVPVPVEETEEMPGKQSPNGAKAKAKSDDEETGETAFTFRLPAPVVNMPQQPAPVIHLPAQPAPVVHVAAPIVNVPAPIVNVAAPIVRVSPAPVNVQPAPIQAAEVKPRRPVALDFDKDGRVIGFHEKP